MNMKEPLLVSGSSTALDGEAPVFRAGASMLEMLMRFGALSPMAPANMPLSYCYLTLFLCVHSIVLVCSVVALFGGTSDFGVAAGYFLWAAFVAIQLFCTFFTMKKHGGRLRSFYAGMCSTSEDARLLECDIRSLLIVLLFAWTINVVSFGVIVFSGLDFPFVTDMAFGNVLWLRILLWICVMPVSLSWLLPCVLLASIFRGVERKLSQISAEVEKHCQCTDANLPFPLLPHSIDGSQCSDDGDLLLRVVQQLDGYVSFVQYFNKKTVHVLAVSILFNAGVGVFEAAVLIRLVGESATNTHSRNVLFMVLFWFLCSLVYLLVILWFGASVNTRATYLVQYILDSPAFSRRNSTAEFLETSHTVDAILKRHAANRHAFTASGLPLTRSLLFRVFSISITFILFLANLRFF
eukprot:ANDGO_04381.mRNA.1 hypothetical protein